MHHEDSLYVRPFVERDDPPQRVYEFQAGVEGSTGRVTRQPSTRHRRSGGGEGDPARA
jgi:hypothetical protein